MPHCCCHALRLPAARRAGRLMPTNLIVSSRNAAQTLCKAELRLKRMLEHGDRAEGDIVRRAWDAATPARLEIQAPSACTDVREGVLFLALRAWMAGAHDVGVSHSLRIGLELCPHFCTLLEWPDWLAGSFLWFGLWHLAYCLGSIVSAAPTGSTPGLSMPLSKNISQRNEGDMKGIHRNAEDIRRKCRETKKR